MLANHKLVGRSISLRNRSNVHSYLRNTEDVDAKVVGMKNVKNKIDMELDAQDAEFERLFECPEGCGRTFKRAALEKHVKVCKKLFQVKNDDAVGYEDDGKANKPGKVQARGGSVQPQKAAAEPQVIKKPMDKQKWKQESDNLKKLMKKGTAAPQTEDVVMVKEKDGVVVEKIPEAKLCAKCEEGFQTEMLLKEHSGRCKGKPRVSMAAAAASKPHKPMPEQNFDDEF
jgi:zinc-finger of a C2HC-type